MFFCISSTNFIKFIELTRNSGIYFLQINYTLLYKPAILAYIIYILHLQSNLYSTVIMGTMGR